MDNLTHTLTGLALSRAGLNRVCPHATAILLLAANAPDLDAISAAWGALTYLHFHRYLTHAIIALPVMALVALAVARVIVRRPLAWKRGFLVALIGVASHLLLDSTNVYGIRLLLPFSGQWFHWDISSVVDPWIWAVLLLSVVAPLLSRLIGSEIGARQSGPARGFAIFALAFIVLYDASRAVIHLRAVAVLDSRLYQGVVPAPVAAFPGSANPLRWRGLVETSTSFSLHDLDVFGPFDPDSGRFFYKPEPSPALEIARRTPTFQGFLEFSLYPAFSVSPVDDPEGGTRVSAVDLRFGTPLDLRFSATAILDQQLQVERSFFTFGRMRPR